MRDLSSILQHAVSESHEILNSLGELDQQMRRAADAIENCLASGHKLLVCGNYRELLAASLEVETSFTEPVAAADRAPDAVRR